MQMVRVFGLPAFFQDVAEAGQQYSGTQPSDIVLLPALLHDFRLVHEVMLVHAIRTGLVVADLCSCCCCVAVDPFWKSVPTGAFWPMLIVATAASVVASQALISGVYSIMRQVCNPEAAAFYSSGAAAVRIDLACWRTECRELRAWRALSTQGSLFIKEPLV